MEDTRVPEPGDLEYAKEVLRAEAEAVAGLVPRVGTSFGRAIELVFDCGGRVVATGMGKAGIVAQKVSATLASTGTPSHWLHPSEARHGDLGRVVKQDVVLAFSHSGETNEIILLLSSIKKIGAGIIAVTGNAESTLAEHSSVTLDIGRIEEACPLGLAPSASTTAMLAYGDALALAVARKRNLSKEEYAFYHPGGDLGRRLITVEMAMRTGAENPVVTQDTPVREVLQVMTETEGAPGAASVVDQEGKLVGFFTDGDVRRRLRDDTAFVDAPVSAVMTRSPKVINVGSLASEAARILKEKRIDQLAVVDDSGAPVGILDVQDLLDVGQV